MSKTLSELPVVEFTTAEEFEAWLAEHHDTSPGVWIKLAKVGSESDALSFEASLRTTLCFGWISGVRRAVDTEHYLQKYTPGDLDRAWDWYECDTAEWLIEQGRMRPAGMALVEAARADGRWERAYTKRGELPVPDLLKARLASYPDAKAFFETLAERDRNAIVNRLRGLADRETYMRRVDQIVDMLQKGETPY